MGETHKQGPHATHSWKDYDVLYGLVFKLQEQKRLIYDDTSPERGFFPGLKPGLVHPAADCLLSTRSHPLHL